MISFNIEFAKFGFCRPDLLFDYLRTIINEGPTASRMNTIASSLFQAGHFLLLNQNTKSETMNLINKVKTIEKRFLAQTTVDNFDQAIIFVETGRKKAIIIH